jgi:ketosteroid isomerase-like protein
VNADQIMSWVAAYERAWRTPGTEALAGLFTPDATYRMSPYDQAVTGLPAIGRLWEAERDGPDEVFRMERELVAADGDIAVLRIEVWYGDPVRQEYRDLWIVRFAPDGRCAAFEEWPFWPAQPYSGRPSAPGE